MGCGPSKSRPHNEPPQVQSYDAPPQVARGQALYHPLNSAGREIRLLIVPYTEVGHDSPIRCNLVQTSLDKAPKYEALSYVWLVERLRRVGIHVGSFFF
jgi:hypothetical protein